MIIEKEVEIVKVADLGDCEIQEYESALIILAEEMGAKLNSSRAKHMGKIKSMAMAYAKGFNYFISGDRAARVAAKKHLINLDGNYLITIQMKDIIVHIKNNSEALGINRKKAKILYTYHAKPALGRDLKEVGKLKKIHTKLKKEFDEILWRK